MSVRRVNVACSTTSAEAMPARPTREGGFVYNASGQIAYVAYGAADASATSFTVTLADGELHELGRFYTGPAQVILAASTGNVRVTEWY